MKIKDIAKGFITKSGGKDAVNFTDETSVATKDKPETISRLHKKI